MTTERAIKYVWQLIREYDQRAGNSTKSVLMDLVDRIALQTLIDAVKQPAAVAATPDPRIVAIQAAINGTGGPRSKLDAVTTILESK